MTKINAVAAAAPTADFTVENDRVRGITYYTPETTKAFDWSHGTPEGSETQRPGGLKGVPMFGRSFMFKSDSQRASKLRGFLKGEGFTVNVQAAR